MGLKTSITWCDSTLNLMMGCQGCEIWNSKTRTCYAGVMTEKYAGGKGWPQSFDKPIIFPERLDQALKWSDLTGKERPDKPWLNGLPRIIFLNDMGDTFTESLPFDWLMPFIPRMEASPHIYMFLTKRARRMRTFFARLGYVPKNFWLGATVTDQASANGRIKELVQIPDGLLYLSIEPLLESIRLFDSIELAVKKNLFKNHLQLVIVGGESGPNPRPFFKGWGLDLLYECRVAEIKYFFKQMGGYPDKREVLKSIPPELCIREMPEIITRVELGQMEIFTELQK